MNDFMKAISEVEVVSFDIFDTLIVRLYRQPTDLFLHLETSTGNIGFKDARILAEQVAREKAFSEGVHEVTLDQIYQQMHPSYVPMREKEIELERLACKANPEMMKVYQAALQQGKRIFISSDMYLPKETIEQILQNAGYTGYEKLILSSETMRPKYTMEMYEDLLAESGVQPQKILHIGDNYETDYENAKKSGIQAYHYDPIRETVGDNWNSAYFALLNDWADREVAASILKGMITLEEARHPGKPYWEQFGYKYAGMLVVGYCQWLKQQFDKEGIQKAYFMLRDGYIVKRVFDYLYPEFETMEIYGSRRMFLFARMNRYEDIQEYVGAMLEGVSYSALYHRLLIDSEELYEEYVKTFPNQDGMITDVAEIHQFMKKNEKLLLDVAQKESKIIVDYINHIGLPGEKCAVVDLGWRCSMLKGLCAVCDRYKIKHNLYGYYVGTHRYEGSKLKVASYGISNGKPNDTDNVVACMNSAYIVDVLELIFSAPHPSVLKLKRTETGFEPVYQSRSIHEDERMHISQAFLEATLAFAREYWGFVKEFPVTISAEVALLPMYYLDKSISRFDQKKIASVFVLPGMGDDTHSVPLVKIGRGSIGIIDPWPGDISGESEAIMRMKKAAEDVGYIPMVMDQYGYLLDNKNRRTSVRADVKNIDFIITTQYETHKAMDAFYYHALWNPPEIPLNFDYYSERIVNNYISNDDFLIYDSGGMYHHLQAMLMHKPRTIQNASMLTASFPASTIKSPHLDNPKLFYCGMNWDVTVNHENRHEGLFKLLDTTGKVKFFGPEVVKAWGNIRPWKGYKSYCGQIPFDGFSILREINDCGICLVLSSDIHRRAGAATNRTYEACAAGAVIISDQNEFMMRYFKDAALFISYDKNDPQHTFDQIMEKYEWIVANKDKALELARRAQNVFIKQLSLDVQLKQIMENHSSRFEQIKKDLFAKDESKRVLVTYVLNSQYVPHIDEYLKPVIENIQNQYYRNIELCIGADLSLVERVKEYCNKRCANAKVVAIKIFDQNGSKILSDGQVIRKLQKLCKHDYWINTTSKEVWFYDHISTLVRTIEDANCTGAYSGSLVENSMLERKIQFFNTINQSNFYDALDQEQCFTLPGQFLFKAEAHTFMPDFLFDTLDGLEHIAYALMLKYKDNRTLEFSKRMTFSNRLSDVDNRAIIMQRIKQIRFIKDLVKFDLPDCATQVTVAPSAAPVSGDTVPTSQMVGDMFARLPLRYWILLRYYRFMMRKVKPNSRRYKKYEEKHAAIWDTYNQYWRK